MNRTLRLVALACLTLLVPPVRAGVAPGSGLAGGPHDFTNPASKVYQRGRSTNMCTFCHVDQNGSAAVRPPQWDSRLPTAVVTWSTSNRASGRSPPDAFENAPAWNPELIGRYGSYAMYEGGSGAPRVGGSVSFSRTPGSTSLLCLSCHDGSVAINWYGNAFQLTERGVIGKNNSLANHHPIGFDYDAVRSLRKQIRPADAAYLTATTTVRDHLYGPENMRMECGTCHSVHNTGNSGETFLWKSDARSRLCLTCHDKGT